MSLDKQNTYSALTTFNLKKHPYGLEMINSFFVNCPDEVKLTAFIENASIMKKVLIYNYFIYYPIKIFT